MKQNQNTIDLILDQSIVNKSKPNPNNLILKATTKKSLKFFKYITKISLSPNKQYLLINCSAEAILIMDKKTFLSVGLLVLHSGSIVDFFVHTESKCMFLLSNRGNQVYIIDDISSLKVNIKNVQSLDYNKDKYCLIHASKKDNFVYFGKNSSGNLLVTKFSGSTYSFEILRNLENLVSDMAYSIGCNVSGSILMSKGHFYRSISKKINLKKNKFQYISTEVLSINCIIVSEKKENSFFLEVRPIFCRLICILRKLFGNQKFLIAI